jgi:hypothetical protein
MAGWAFQPARAGPQYVAQTFQPAGEETPFAPTSHPCQPAPLASPAPHQANQSPGSALCQRAGAVGDCQARLPDRNVHRPKVTCAGDIPRQATCPSSQALSFLRPTARASTCIAQRSGVRCWRLLGGVLQVESPAARVSVARLLFQQDSL